MVALLRKHSVEPAAAERSTAQQGRGRGTVLSASFNRAVQTLDEATESARRMAASLEKKGLLMRAPTNR